MQTSMAIGVDPAPLAGPPAADEELLATLEPLTDEELTAAALAADPDTTVGDEAVSFYELRGARSDPLLPEWYMPSPMGATSLAHGWRRRVVLLIIVSFLTIAASGLCSTYGQIVIA